MKLFKQYTDDYVTELEALEKENESITELEALENLNDIAYYEDGYDDLARQSYLTLKVAIKRNEPMKVDLTTECDWFYNCPNCDGPNIIERSRYCPDCGQLLDWSDEK